jgi:hypothetical protein
LVRPGVKGSCIARMAPKREPDEEKPGSGRF